MRPGRRRLAALAAALAAVAMPAAAASLLPEAGDPAAIVAALESDGLDVGDLRLRLAAAKAGASEPFPDVRLEIRREARQVYRTAVAMLWTVVDVRDDVTGDGRPLAVLGSYSGGAHCCATLDFVTLDDKPRRAATLALGHGDVPEAADLFTDADGDGRIDLRLYDQTFAYWIVSFAESPFTPIVVHWRDGRFRLNPAAMRKPPMTEAALEAAAAVVRGDERWTEGQPPPLLWETMLRSIFSGNAADAWALLARAWPPETPGREAFARDFRAKLKTSPWWLDVAALNPAGL